jgi:hypothetical protein
MILTTLTPVKYPIHTGNRQVIVGYGNAPAAGYNSTTGDIISVAFTPFFIDAVLGVAVTTDGTYIGIPAPTTGVGNAQTWALFWYTFSFTGTPGWVPLSSAVSIATKQVQLTVIGGA